MCRIPKVLVVAPQDKHTDLRKALSSFEYDIVATVEKAADAASISGDVAVVWEPDEGTVGELKDRGFKIVAVGGNGSAADMSLAPDEVSTFKSRIWELFRPA